MATDLTSTSTDLSPDQLAQTDAALAEAKEILASENVLAEAKAQLAAMADAASAANQVVENSGDEYSLHMVEGVGRYAVIRRTGWLPLLKIIKTPEANIDFSVNQYPGFDAVIGKHFNSPYLLDPLNDKYDTADYRHLRENLAAVRNFLMETYYVNTPAGMTPAKAEKALSEIAAYIGDGLSNNYKFLGLIANHDPNKPFISLREASQPGGVGAQYIYDKVLAMHRQSGWLRPFSAVLALFGSSNIPNWMLPPAHTTEFTDILHEDIVALHGNGGTPGAPTKAQIEAGIDRVDALEARRDQLLAQRNERIARQQMGASATDLDALGNHLLHSAATMQDVASLSEPVRRDAIDIAKDILRKLKVSLGNVNIMDGLKLPPADDLSTFGALKGVALVYQRLLGYSRTLDPSIMQHPSILAATRALGQMGYLAKLEALRMARMAGDTATAQAISGQLARIPAVYATAPDATFGGLISKVEQGIETMMSRMQTISGPGAHVGFSPGKDIGSSISAPPTAGMAQQITNAQNNAAQRNAQLLAAEAAQQQAQATRAPQAAQQPQRAEPAKTSSAPAQANTGRGMGKPLVQPGRAQRSSSTSSQTLNPTNPNSLAARQQALRNSLLHHAHEEHEEHEHQVKQQQLMEQQRLQQLNAAKKAAAKAAVQKIDPKMLQGFQTATSAKGLVGEPVNPTTKSMYGKIIAKGPQQAEPNKFTSTVKSPTAPQTPASADPLDDKNRPVPPTPRGHGGRGL